MVLSPAQHETDLSKLMALPLEERGDYRVLNIGCCSVRYRDHFGRWDVTTILELWMKN